MISSLINRYRHEEQCLILDTTDNPKYGLEKVAIKMKNLSNGGYSKGYKILLCLLRMKDKTIPVGFALIHKESQTQEEPVLNMLGRLRNEFKLKPKITIANAVFSTQEIIKRLNNYGWGFVIKEKKNYSLDNKQIKRLIKRG